MIEWSPGSFVATEEQADAAVNEILTALTADGLLAPAPERKGGAPAASAESVN